MNPPARFEHVGVVEGFYGPVWEPAQREGFIEALRPWGLNTYLYAPKHEQPLAAGVMEPLNGEQRQRLGRFAAFCGERGIAPWAGLHLEPPLEVTIPAHLEAAARKCAELEKLGFAGFALLFDDLSAGPQITDPGGPFGSSLAAAQGHAVTEIRSRARALGVGGGWWVCPSRYTLDPILEKEYGEFEPGYLARLDAALPPEVAWFWTGPRVVSRTVTLDHLAAWGGGNTRPVVLWDNYPVNDAGMARHLHLGPLRGRAADLPRGVRSYLFNPLLQPALGVLPGATCLAYGADPPAYDPERAWDAALAALAPPLREALRDLETLTRHCCQGMHPAPRGGLAADLEREWAKTKKGGRAATGVVERFGAVLAALHQHLPAGQRAEAAPWLERLGQALAVFRGASRGSADPAAAMAYRVGGAEGLGKWFDP